VINRLLFELEQVTNKMFRTFSLKATCAAHDSAEKAIEQITDKIGEAKTAARGAAQDAADRAKEQITDTMAETRAATSRYCLNQIKEALEGEAMQVAKAPDVSIAILEVKMPEKLDVENLLNFRLEGLDCRARLEVVGTAPQLAGMVAAGTIETALGKAEAALPGWDFIKKTAATVAAAKDKLASSAAAGTAKKTVEFNMYLDLGVTKAGLEVSTNVTIVQEALAKVEKIVPVPRAVAYVEEAVRQKIQKAAQEWARNAAKKKVGSYVGEKHSETVIKGVAGAITTGSSAVAAASPAMDKISAGLAKAKAAARGNL
jgi:hypothetical protein